MASIDESTKHGVFTYTWSIRNFCWSLQAEPLIFYSPYFYFDHRQWNLRVIRNEENGSLSLSLNHERYLNNYVYTLSILEHTGLFKVSRELNLTNDSIDVWKELFSVRDLKKICTHLGKLTFCCRLWIQYDQTLKSANCMAETKRKILKLDYVWTLEDIIKSEDILKIDCMQTAAITKFDSVIPKIYIHLLTEDSFGDDVICFAIEVIKKQDLFMTYKINLLGSSGSVVHSKLGEILFKSDTSDTWKFPFLPRRKLLSNAELYLPANKLLLKCEFSFYGEYELVRYEYGTSDLVQSKPPTPSLVGGRRDLWKENMRQFYSDGEFSDLIVRTPNLEFPVARAILCAQSEVFRRRLKHDMKENNSGVIEIADFEDDTVSKMLEEIDCALAMNLCLTADKYRIEALQRVCSKILKDKMDISNVCDILFLADQVRDQELKSCARNFIVFRCNEIMNTDGWKSLKKSNVDLFAETTEWMILNNFLNNKK